MPEGSDVIWVLEDRIKYLTPHELQEMLQHANERGSDTGVLLVPGVGVCVAAWRKCTKDEAVQHIADRMEKARRFSRDEEEE